MAVLIRDILEDGGRLEVTCLGCGQVNWIWGDKLLRMLAGRRGLDMRVVLIQSHGRCRRCGARGEVRIVFPTPAIERWRHAREARGEPVVRGALLPPPEE